jgi:hypothetical protein
LVPRRRKRPAISRRKVRAAKKARPPSARLPLPKKSGGRHDDDRKYSREKERRRLRRELSESGPDA